MPVIKWTLPFLLGFFFCMPSFAQNKTITGNVSTAGDNTPLSGVTVNVKGTENSVITDASGNFSLRAATGQTLVFSYVGYANKEVEIGAGNTVSVILSRSAASTLQDVVIVGYGTQKRENLTGAVATVDVAKTFASKPINDPAKALQGVVPGLTILYGNGGLTAGASVNIRVYSKITSDFHDGEIV